MATIFDDDLIDFDLYMRETDNKVKVKPAASYRQALKDRLRFRRDQKLVYLPWEKTRENFDFRKGEVTVWAGVNGHGKSLITSQVALSLMGQDQKVVIASFEIKPLITMERLSRMFSGTNPYSPEYQSDQGIAALDDLYDEFCDWTDGRLWLYDHVGSAEGSKVVGMARYCSKEAGINHIFIDNLAKCVKNEDDYNGQKAFVDEMMVIAQDYGVHVHIVHHLKKPPKETDKPDKSDVKGSGAIVDQPDNLFLVWRNKNKEEDRKAGLNKKADEPDQILFCRKNRNHYGSGEGEPNIALWFNRDAGHFVGDASAQPQFFCNYPHYPSNSTYP
jgi:twinkle protein